MNLRARLRRLEVSPISRCGLCGGDGRLIIGVPPRPQDGCARCGAVKFIRFPFMPPSDVRPGFPGWYRHLAELGLPQPPRPVEPDDVDDSPEPSPCS